MTREPIEPGTRRAAPTSSVADWQPEITIEASLPAPEWDGTCTRVQIAFPMIRDHVVVGAGDTVVFKACQDVNGRWIGPEAGHVEDLYVRGMFLGSRPQVERAAETAAIEHQRGVYQQTQRDAEGNVIQRPMTELAARTTEQVQREWERTLSMHVKDDKKRVTEIRRRERQEARSGEEGAEDLAAAITKMLSGGTRRGAGVEGPGTAPISEE